MARRRVWLATGNPHKVTEVAEILAECGYDCAMIDMEHGPLSEGDAIALMRAMKGTAFEVLEKQFEGTTAIAYTGEDAVALAKALTTFIKATPKIVISTHTISLQEQLIRKDLPLLNAVIPREF